MSTGSHDRALLSRLLRPLTEAVQSVALCGRDERVSFARTVFRAGYVVVRVGAFLISREHQRNTLGVSLIREEQEAAEHDIQAIEEMILAHDIGSPFPTLPE